MERRANARKPRRLGVSFWKRDSDKRFVGYTVNISTTGMYVATNHPATSGSRVLLRVGGGERSFMIEAVVVRVIQSTQALQAVRQSGMGLRFMQVDELITELLPELAVAAPETREGIGTPAAASPPPPAASAPPPPAGLPTFPLRFADRAKFREAYARDLVTGGLFVPTQRPAPLDAIIVVELGIDEPGVIPIRLRARVVHRVEPSMPNGGMGSNLMAGMGVELLEFDQTLAALKAMAGS